MGRWLSTAGEVMVMGLIRACRNTPGHLSRMGDAAFEIFARAGQNSVFGPGQAQSTLWVQDAPELPARPWRVSERYEFHCVALNCQHMTAHNCALRQAVTERQRTLQASRGQGTEYPHCDTLKCAQGRGIREALGPGVNVTWHGAGPGGRFERGQPGRGAQVAREHSRVPTLDEPPREAER